MNVFEVVATGCFICEKDLVLLFAKVPTHLEALDKNNVLVNDLFSLLQKHT